MCLLGDGRLLTAFTDRTFRTTIFEELTLPIHMRYAIKSITYQRMSAYIYIRQFFLIFSFYFSENDAYIVLITNYLGFLAVQLMQCQDKLCLLCWTDDCLIKQISSDEYEIE